MRFLKRFLTVVVLIMIIYLLGPQPSHPDYKTDLPVVPTISRRT
jgi:hypothetical protein